MTKRKFAYILSIFKNQFWLKVQPIMNFTTLKLFLSEHPAFFHLTKDSKYNLPFEEGFCSSNRTCTPLVKKRNQKFAIILSPLRLYTDRRDKCLARDPAKLLPLCFDSGKFLLELLQCNQISHRNFYGRSSFILVFKSSIP